MSRSDLEYLQHILDEIDYLAAEAPTLSLESFLADETRKRAFVRSIEIVGEPLSRPGASRCVAGSLTGCCSPALTS